MSDHPRSLRIETSLTNQCSVRPGVLLFHDGRMAEIDRKSRSIQLQFLLFRIALSEQREIVPRRKIFERFRHAANQLDRMAHDLLGEAHHSGQVLRSNLTSPHLFLPLRQFSLAFPTPLPL